MKRCVMICILAFLVVWCLNTDVMASKQRHYWGKAKTESNSNFHLWIGFKVEKEVSPDSEGYNAEFRFDDSALSDVKKIQIKAPNGKKAELINGLRFNSEISLPGGGSFEEFQSKFPEGKYTVKFSPSKFGSADFHLTYDFPSTPQITYPKDGATGMPLSFTIEWESLEDIDSIMLKIEADSSDDFSFKRTLTTDSISFTVPDGFLQPNTTYEIVLIAIKHPEEDSDSLSYEMCSNRVISFTTGSE